MDKYCFQSQYLERKIQSMEASSTNLPLAVLALQLFPPDSSLYFSFSSRLLAKLLMKNTGET